MATLMKQRNDSFGKFTNRLKTKRYCNELRDGHFDAIVVRLIYGAQENAYTVLCGRKINFGRGNAFTSPLLG